MLHHLMLHLARSRPFPEGNPRYGAEITPSLDEEGHLSREELGRKRIHCRVRHFWVHDGERQGALIHPPDGAGGATWMIDPNQDRAGGEEAGCHLHRHRFAEGENVTVARDDGKPCPFQVVTVAPAEQAGSEEHR